MVKFLKYILARTIKGKPVEKWGRKATGAKGFAANANATASQLPNTTDNSVY